jgi:hypothetical protein
MAKPHESGGMEWLIAGAVLKRLLLVVYVAAVFITESTKALHAQQH